jgi:histidine ammonia-lyase
MDMVLELDGYSLTAAQVVRIARQREEDGRWPEVRLSAGSLAKLERTREYIEREWMRPDAPPIYGFNTGVGKLKDSAIPLDQIKLFQAMLINSHSAGIGEPLPQEVVRATLLLRANALARGCSGLRPSVVERLLGMLNAGVHPVIPQLGSVGASGDLTPLAHLAGALVGHPQAEAYYEDQRMAAKEALEVAGIRPVSFELAAKDGLALINGSTISLALAVLAAHDARQVLANAEIALALSLEAMRGELAAFDARVHASRPHLGQLRTAENVRKITAGSQRCSEAARQVALPDESRVAAQTIPARVQDAYSLRCAPQVHGPARDALDYIDGLLATEINSTTDNPLIFQTAEGYDVLSGGNFHGQYLAQAMDLLAMVTTDLGSISERRSYRMLDPTMSYGLPSNLVAKLPGLNTGYSIAHCSMAALVTENKTLCWPASVDSVPTKSNQEDHVSNSTWSARKARTVIENTQQIVATEMLIAAQAISLTEPLLGQFSLGDGTTAAYAAIRERIPAALEGDRWLHADLAAALDLVRSGAVWRAVEGVVGTLA